MVVKLTKKGYLRLKAEFDQLSREERPLVVKGVATAAAEGDRSENAEYIYGKKRLREIDKRLKYLSGLLKDPTVVSSHMVTVDTVGFGCKVTVCNENDEKKQWTIVGVGEADFKEKTISYQAPVAQAILGKKVGDIVDIELLDKEMSLEILNIEVGHID